MEVVKPGDVEEKIIRLAKICELAWTVAELSETTGGIGRQKPMKKGGDLRTSGHRNEY